MKRKAEYINRVILEKDSMRCGNEVLKISNISRTVIFTYENKEKIAFENEKTEFKNEKERYELKRNEDKIKYGVFAALMIAMVIMIVVMIFSLSLPGAFIFFLFFLAFLGLWIFEYYKEYTPPILTLPTPPISPTPPIPTTHPIPPTPPLERDCPDEFGLKIEMNSKYFVIFSAIGDAGKQNLKELQEKIHSVEPNYTATWIDKSVTIVAENNSNVNLGENYGVMGNDNSVETSQPLQNNEDFSMIS